MPYSLAWEKCGIYCEFTGEVTSQDFYNYSVEAYGDERFCNVRYQLFNYLDAQRITFGYRDIIKVAAIDRAMATANFGVRCATVGSFWDLEALSNLYHSEMKGSSWDACYFDSIDSARSWLGLAPVL